MRDFTDIAVTRAMIEAAIDVVGSSPDDSWEDLVVQIYRAMVAAAAPASPAPGQANRDPSLNG